MADNAAQTVPLIGFYQQCSGNEAMGWIEDTVGAISAKLGDVICTRKVFVPNGKTKRSFEGHIVGRFQRVGPNSWDDYQFISEPGGPVEVFPGPGSVSW